LGIKLALTVATVEYSYWYHL